MFLFSTLGLLLTGLNSAIMCLIFSTLDDKLAPTSLIGGAIFEGLGSPTPLCILGSRLFFNLKEAAEHRVNIGTNWSSYSHSAIRFQVQQDGEPQPEYATISLKQTNSQGLSA